MKVREFKPLAIVFLLAIALTLAATAGAAEGAGSKKPPLWSVKSQTSIDNAETRDLALMLAESEVEPYSVLSEPADATLLELSVRRNQLLNSARQLRGTWPAARLDAIEKNVNEAFEKILELNGDRLLRPAMVKVAKA